MADFRRLQELRKWNGAEVPVTKSGPKPILSSILALGMVGNLREFHCDKEYFVHHDLLSAIGGLHLMGDDGETPVWWSIYRGFTALIARLRHRCSAATIQVSNHTLLNTVIQKIYIVLIFSATVNAVNNFVTIFMVLKGLLTEAEVVANSFNRIFDQASVIPLTQEASSSNSDESTFWDQLNQQFAEHINQHCILLGHIQTIRPLLEGTFLVIYYVTAFNIACGCFFVMAQDKPFNIYTIQVVNLIILQTFECFVYTYLTTKLKDVHSSIGQAVYCLSWPQNLKFSERFGPQYRAVRAKLTLIQERCNQDVRFSTGGHFEFTQERFTELMNMTYTLVTFLWEMKKGG
ncbi:Odorant receptor 7a [Culex quinquefasciatus]|uniref:Odorant receptor n=1 Tax=Culex quinquefasciatus TaxID=7176 RepID=B0WZN3_CULQU|nr:Odorant receptor 7a [Culex quinquefasciatus]|eukprot:XP_001862855.1 Odorant receptor 7a [Culex quinquefasciatus]